MWAWGGGAACGALVAALLLALAARCRRRHKCANANHQHANTTGAVLLHQVHIVSDTRPSVCACARPPTPRRVSLALARADDAPSPSRPAPPTIQLQPPATAEADATPEQLLTIATIPKLPLPEQLLHKRTPLDYKYIPRPLHPIPDIGTSEGSSTEPHKKFSITRSPSLEKDDKSPFVASAKSDASDVFLFNTATDMAAEMSPKIDEIESPNTLRRFRSVSTKLNMCSVSESQENMEMQNSPRTENNSARERSRFDFSPNLFDSLTSPNFFTPPEMVSPAFFAEPKSVYYDSVRSPKFFAETPEVPQSPKALMDQNRAETKPNSPRVLSARPSPKVYVSNKENYFNFDLPAMDEGAAKMSPKPRRYSGRNSIERERFTPLTSPADKDAKKYRRTNSCDTNYKNVEVNIINNNEDNKNVENGNHVEQDVVDCCAKMEYLSIETEEKPREKTSQPNSPKTRRQRLKSISLDSDNAKIIEQNLGLPIAKQMKDQMNAAYKHQEVSASCESMERTVRMSPQEGPVFRYDGQTEEIAEDMKSPDLKKRSLRQSSDTQSFLDMPRFSPKEFEIHISSEDDADTVYLKPKRKDKNLRNLTIDLTKRDSDLEKELLEFEKLYSDSEAKVKTPTLKVKATSLDSSESVNLSLPQKKTLEVPQNSVSVPNTPKRQIKRLLAQKNVKQCGEQRRLLMKGQDSGIFLRENHASLMLYQPSCSRRAMCSFDEKLSDKAPEINIMGIDNRQLDPSQMLGSNLLNYKPNLSVSSTNLKTLPEGVPSDDFEPTAEDEKYVKKLHRRNSNQSLMISTHSLQSSNCSLSSAGTSCHNLAGVRPSASNYSLGSQKVLSFERRDSDAHTEHLTPTTKVMCHSNTNLSGETSKNCLLQRRGSNNSLTLNIHCTNALSRHSSNSSLNKEVKPAQKKGLLERRSSNTSLTLNINNSNPQLSIAGNRGLSISNYNLDGSTCNLSRYNSNQSIDNPTTEHRKGILERRSSNTSLTLNIVPQEPRDIEIDETVIERNLKELPTAHRKSLSTENLLPKSYKMRPRLKCGEHKFVGFGSHDNLWSESFREQDCPQNLTYVCGDQENEIIYAFGRHEETSQGFTRNITTKPLSPQSTSEDFRLYLANMHQLQNASSVLSRKQLKDLHEVFQNGYSTFKCLSTNDGQHCCSNDTKDESSSIDNPQMVLPDISQPCSEYQKMLFRNLHQEFWDMPSNFQEKPLVCGSHTKNRYKTILPNEHSRFLLKGETPSSGEGYINANYIKGHEDSGHGYIATQGPLQNTIFDFWRMVRQNCQDHRKGCDSTGNPIIQGVQKIVMLTNFVEKNRQKCEQYFPTQLEEEITFFSSETSNSFAIKNTGIIQKEGYTIRRLQVKFNGEISDTETVYHYWFQNWADHTCPKDVHALLNLSLDVLKDIVYEFSEHSDVTVKSETPNFSPDPRFSFPPPKTTGNKIAWVNAWTPSDCAKEGMCPPTIVHCSAGIGRTGCFIAILNGIRQLLSENKVDVLGIVCNLRLDRGGMVQNSEQYELVHKVLCLFTNVCMTDL